MSFHELPYNIRVCGAIRLRLEACYSLISPMLEEAGAQRVGTWSTWSAVISLTSRAGELRSAPSGPDDRYRVTG